jgi:hypothetical protein
MNKLFPFGYHVNSARKFNFAGSTVILQTHLDKEESF